jgi:hypothetical protein
VRHPGRTSPEANDIVAQQPELTVYELHGFVVAPHAADVPAL